jgi:hypothetical protein
MPHPLFRCGNGLFKNMKKIALLLITLLLFTSCESISKNSETARVIGRDISYDSGDSAALASLDESEKAAYEKLKQAAAEYNSYVVFDTDFTKEEIVRIFSLLYTQENGIFWLDSIASPAPDDNAVSISFRFKKEDVKYMQSVLTEKTNTIISGIPKDADDFTKIKYIHDYIVKNCDFTKEGDTVSTAYGVLVDGKGQCDGYASSFGLLASKIGLECVTVTGTDSAGNTHAWNKVKSNGNWYNIDCTWDDPIIDYENPGYIRYSYMLVPDKYIMNITHFENTKYFVSPPCTAISDNYFFYENLIFDKADSGIKTLGEQIKTAALTLSTECEIKFENKTIYDEAIRKLLDEDGLRGLIDTANAGKSTFITNVYTAKDDTLFIIHLSLVY